MHSNVFCVLDKGIPSSHLDSDSVGALGQECEGDAAVQGDERLKDRRRNAHLVPCGIS